MQQINLAAVDLNLLVVFDALMRERNVTRAASRVGLTQSAASHALTRLRALFGDDLFVRTPRGMEPTAHALDIAGPVAAVLAQVEGILAPGATFTPGQSSRVFRIGLSDYAAFVLLPGLIERVERDAPGIRLIVQNTSHGQGHAMLDAGEVELIAGNFPVPPQHMCEELLFEEDFLCAVRPDHPEIGESLDASTYFRSRHLHVSSRGGLEGYPDRFVREGPRRRRIGVTVGHFLLAPFLLRFTDAIATEPRRILAPLAETLGLRLFPPPVDIPPFRVTQVWPRRLDKDARHVWLREMVKQAAGVTAAET